MKNAIFATLFTTLLAGCGGMSSSFQHRGRIAFEDIARASAYDAEKNQETWTRRLEDAQKEMAELKYMAANSTEQKNYELLNNYLVVTQKLHFSYVLLHINEEARSKGIPEKLIGGDEARDLASLQLFTKKTLGCIYEIKTAFDIKDEPQSRLADALPCTLEKND